jgi:hypothetical protein
VWCWLRSGRIGYGLALGVILILLFLSLPMAPAKAVGGGIMTLTPNEGKVGDQIKVDGSGFVADLPLRIYFSSNLANTGDDFDTAVTAYSRVTEAHIGVSGSFASATFVVPGQLADGSNKQSVGTGDYYLYGVYTGSTKIVAAATFWVMGPVVLTPSKAKIGEWVRISADGLNKNDIVYLYFSSNRAAIGGYIDQQVTSYKYLGMVPTSSAGSLAGGFAFQVPDRLADGRYVSEVHGGDYYVYTSYYFGNKRIETASRFTVADGEIQLDPVEGVVGTSVKVSGQGLRPNQRVTFKYDGDSFEALSGDNRTDGTGRFNSTIVIPEGVSGSHVITATDEVGNQPLAYFSVSPTITVSPSSVVANETVEVRGTGFGDKEYIFVTVNGDRMPTTLPDPRTDHRGGFTINFAAPPTAIGSTAQVEVSDKSFNKAQAPLTVLALPSGTASLSLAPVTSAASPGYVGMEVTVSGAKFSPKAAVTVSYDGAAVALKTDADLRGEFSTTFTIPPGKAGNHTVSATDGTNTGAAIFVMESQAPPMPVLTLPKATSVTPATPQFSWSEVKDESGVTYSLQVASDANFVSIVLEKQGLVQPGYLVTGSESLKSNGKQTAYYCRVKAVDGASNEGEWTVPVLFYVGSSGSGISGWLVYVIAAVVVVVIAGVIGFWLRKRAAAH